MQLWIIVSAGSAAVLALLYGLYLFVSRRLIPRIVQRYTAARNGIDEEELQFRSSLIRNSERRASEYLFDLDDVDEDFDLDNEERAENSTSRGAGTPTRQLNPNLLLAGSAAFARAHHDDVDDIFSGEEDGDVVVDGSRKSRAVFI